MGKAQLVVGQPRIGWLIDGDESTPLIGVALEDTGAAIQLRVPWSRGASTDHVLRWFSNRIQFADDPDRVKHQYRPPHHLWFRDPEGIVALVGTRAGSSRNVITHGLGEGRVTVDYAVLGAGFADYSVLNGLRSEFEGLTDWVGIRCLQEESEQDAEHRLAELRLTLCAPDAVKISRSLNLRLQPHFSTERTVRDLAIHETIVVESSSRKGRRWVDHLTAHNAVRDLVAVAWWHLGAYRGQWVTRSTDPLRAMDGTSYGDQWLELRTHKHVRGDPTHPEGWPLFSFTDVGANGLRRWQRLRAAHARGINPLLATLNPRNTGLEANLTLSCIGLDGIGFQLAMDAGVGRSKANNEAHRDRLRRVANEVPYHHSIDVEEWSQRAADAYNGIKHANRDMPDILTMANTLRENCLLFRLWIAHRLGVSDATMTRTLPTDRQSDRYEIL